MISKEDFYKDAEKAVNNIFGDTVEKEPKEITNKSFQYFGVIYWYRVTFNEAKILKNGRQISGFHIKPYRITIEDIAKAAKKGSKGRFNEIIKDDPQFVDYDPQSGNFHKVPDGTYQIVLVDKSAGYEGPGKSDYILREMNAEMYFPRPCESLKCNDIKKLINTAMKYIEDNEQEAE